jgi:hypothetical protein
LALSLAAATLDVYQDGAFYRLEPGEKFVGFVGDKAQAVCENGTFALTYRAECPSGHRLCDLKNEIDALKKSASRLAESQKALRSLLGGVRSAGDAKTLIETARAAGDKMAIWEAKRQADLRKAKLAEARFMRSGTATEAAYVPAACKGRVMLRMPGHWFEFSLYNEATLKSPEGLAVRQLMRIGNRSGVDMVAQKAVFHAEPVRRAIRPVRFTPWLVRHEYGRKYRARQSNVPMMAKSVSAPPAPEAGRVEVAAPRRYVVKNLVLPSGTDRLTVLLRRWRVKAEYGERAYPYRDASVYKTVSFDPPYAIDTDRWRIKAADGRLVATRAYGAYIDGRYTLFTGVDKTVRIDREKLHLKDKESFFGDRVVRKEGYRITLVNESDQTKTITLIDRIPVAQRSDVEVKLRRVSSKLPLQYKLEREGRLPITVTIPPHRSGAVEVRFDVAFDKKKPVVF